jgi:protein CpxP
MKRMTKIVLALVGALVLVAAVGGAAVARGGDFHNFAKRRVTRHIDAALGAINATPEQRTAIYAARDHVFATIAQNAGSRQADLQAALALWQADRIDADKLAALRAKHQSEAKQTGDAIVQALSDAHDALTGAQRQQLVAYLGAHRPPKMDGAKPFFKHMMSERVDDMLDEIGATAQQRTTVHAAVERAFAAVAGEDPTSHFDDAMAVFGADKLDQAKIDALRAQHQARMMKMGDALVQALTDIHDALSAQQRQQVADFVKSHHHGHGG